MPGTLTTTLVSGALVSGLEGEEELVGDVDTVTGSVPSPVMEPTNDPALPSGDGLLTGDDPLGRALARWAADAAVDEAARRRTRARWMRLQAEEEATLAGTLVDLSERRSPVVLDVGQQRVRGTISGVGADFVAMRSDRGQQVLVRIEAIDVVRSEPGSVDVRGDRTVTVDVGFDAVLGPLAADRPDVMIRSTAGVTVRGRLVRAGVDVVRLRVHGEPPVPTWVPMAAMAMVVLDP